MYAFQSAIVGADGKLHEITLTAEGFSIDGKSPVPCRQTNSVQFAVTSDSHAYTLVSDHETGDTFCIMPDGNEVWISARQGKCGQDIRAVGKKVEIYTFRNTGLLPDEEPLPGLEQPPPEKEGTFTRIVDVHDPDVLDAAGKPKLLRRYPVRGASQFAIRGIATDGTPIMATDPNAQPLDVGGMLLHNWSESNGWKIGDSDGLVNGVVKGIVGIVNPAGQRFMWPYTTPAAPGMPPKIAALDGATARIAVSNEDVPRPRDLFAQAVPYVSPDSSVPPPPPPPPPPPDGVATGKIITVNSKSVTIRFPRENFQTTKVGAAVRVRKVN